MQKESLEGENKMSEITFEIKKELGAIGEDSSTGWQRRLCIVSWNGNPPKFDIREWSPDRRKMSRGITLDYEQARAVMELLGKEFDAEERKGESHEL